MRGLLVLKFLGCVAYLPDDLLLELIVRVKKEDELNCPLVNLVNELLFLHLKHFLGFSMAPGALEVVPAAECDATGEEHCSGDDTDGNAGFKPKDPIDLLDILERNRVYQICLVRKSQISFQTRSKNTVLQ